MIVSKLQKIINDQITAELWSANLYLQMSYFLKHQGWDGFAHWMKMHSDEEREHADRMAEFLISRGGQVKLQMINLVPEGWGSVLEVFEHSLEQEKSRISQPKTSSGPSLTNRSRKKNFSAESWTVSN